jgi:hypothetical protein
MDIIEIIYISFMKFSLIRSFDFTIKEFILDTDFYCG